MDVDTVVELFENGDLILDELKVWLSSKGIPDTDINIYSNKENLVVEFDYKGKHYSINTSYTAAQSQLDDNIPAADAKDAETRHQQYLAKLAQNPNRVDIPDVYDLFEFSMKDIGINGFEQILSPEALANYNKYAKPLGINLLGVANSYIYLYLEVYPRLAEYMNPSDPKEAYKYLYENGTWNLTKDQMEYINENTKHFGIQFNKNVNGDISGPGTPSEPHYSQWLINNGAVPNADEMYVSLVEEFRMNCQDCNEYSDSTGIYSGVTLSKDKQKVTIDFEYLQKHKDSDLAKLLGIEAEDTEVVIKKKILQFCLERGSTDGTSIYVEDYYDACAEFFDNDRFLSKDDCEELFGDGKSIHNDILDLADVYYDSGVIGSDRRDTAPSSALVLETVILDTIDAKPVPANLDTSDSTKYTLAQIEEEFNNCSGISDPAFTVRLFIEECCYKDSDGNYIIKPEFEGNYKIFEDFIVYTNKKRNLAMYNISQGKTDDIYKLPEPYDTNQSFSFAYYIENMADSYRYGGHYADEVFAGDAWRGIDPDKDPAYVENFIEISSKLSISDWALLCEDRNGIRDGNNPTQIVVTGCTINLSVKDQLEPWIQKVSSNPTVRVNTANAPSKAPSASTAPIQQAGGKDNYINYAEYYDSTIRTATNTDIVANPLMRTLYDDIIKGFCEITNKYYNNSKHEWNSEEDKKACLKEIEEFINKMLNKTEYKSILQNIVYDGRVLYISTVNDTGMHYSYIEVMPLIESQDEKYYFTDGVTTAPFYGQYDSTLSTPRIYGQPTTYANNIQPPVAAGKDIYATKWDGIYISVNPNDANDIKMLVWDSEKGQYIECPYPGGDINAFITGDMSAFNHFDYLYNGSSNPVANMIVSLVYGLERTNCHNIFYDPKTQEYYVLIDPTITNTQSRSTDVNGVCLMKAELVNNGGIPRDTQSPPALLDEFDADAVIQHEGENYYIKNTNKPYEFRSDFKSGGYGLYIWDPHKNQLLMIGGTYGIELDQNRKRLLCAYEGGYRFTVDPNVFYKDGKYYEYDPNQNKMVESTKYNTTDNTNQAPAQSNIIGDEQEEIVEETEVKDDIPEENIEEHDSDIDDIADSNQEAALTNVIEDEAEETIADTDVIITAADIENEMNAEAEEEGLEQDIVTPGLYTDPDTGIKYIWNPRDKKFLAVDVSLNEKLQEQKLKERQDFFKALLCAYANGYSFVYAQFPWICIDDEGNRLEFDKEKGAYVKA